MSSKFEGKFQQIDEKKSSMQKDPDLTKNIDFELKLGMHSGYIGHKKKLVVVKMDMITILSSNSKFLVKIGSIMKICFLFHEGISKII